MATNAKNLAEYLNNETTSASADIADGSITTAKIADNAVTSAKALNLGRRNIVINGAMKVAQRGTSETGIGATSGYFTLDRFRIATGSTAGRLTMSQASVTDLPGFANAMKLDCTTADTSIAAGEETSIRYRFEGQDLQQLKKGTSSAEKVTVSFYMKTNKAFTFMCELDDTDNNRVNTQQFTTSTSWTRHTITFNGDTTGTLDDDNARSMQLNFWIHAGSTFTGGTYTSNTWQSRASSDNMRAVGIGSFFDNTANEIQLTGLQMEIGDSATNFEHRSFQEELDLCHRYFFNGITANGSGTYSSFPINFRNFVSTGNNGHIAFTIALPKPMRTIPTFTHDLANTNHAGSGTGANANNWQFYHQNQGWGSYAGNGNMNTLSRQGSSDAQVQLGTYYISPNANSYDQLTVGSNRKFHFSAEL